LRAADRLAERLDLSAKLEPTDRDYLAACRKAEQEARARARRMKALVGVLVLLLIGAGVGWWKQDWLREQYRWRMVMGPSVLTAEQPGTYERAEPVHGLHIRPNILERYDLLV
jgi:uncharacterized membrane protein YcjF (UPF0283 family)